MKNFYLCFAFVGLAAVLSSCFRYASERDFDRIYLNMGKDDVMNTMSAHGIARGSILNKYGQVIEVREYEVHVDRPLGYPSVDFYWLFFCEGKLVQWGRAGDWAEVEKKIYEIKFKTS